MGDFLLTRYFLLTNEPDQGWAASISKLDEDFPFSIKYPLGNTYGMILLSKLPLTESWHFLFIFRYLGGFKDHNAIFTRIASNRPDTNLKY